MNIKVCTHIHVYTHYIIYECVNIRIQMYILLRVAVHSMADVQIPDLVPKIPLCTQVKGFNPRPGMLGFYRPGICLFVCLLL